MTILTAIQALVSTAATAPADRHKSTPPPPPPPRILKKRSMVSNLPVATPPAAMPGARSAGAGTRRRRGTRALGAALLALAALVFNAGAAHAQEVLVANMPGYGDDGNVELASANDAAQAFTTGAWPAGATLSSIEIELTTGNGTTPPALTLRSGSADGTVEATFAGPSALTANAADINYTFTAPINTRLQRSTTYWVVAEGGSAGVKWDFTNSIQENATTGWSIADTGETRAASSTGAFSAHSDGAFLMIINGIPDLPPPPARHSALVHNLDQAATTDDVSVSATTPVAQVFRTGASTHGYDLASVELVLGGDISAAERSHLEVGVWTLDSDGRPETRRLRLAPSATSIAASGATDSGTTIVGPTAVFTAPAGSTLDADTPYAVVVSFNQERSLWNTTADTETAAAGFMIDDAALTGTVSGSGTTWAPRTDDRSLLLRVNGAARTAPPPPPPTVTLISNENQTPRSDFGVASQSSTYQLFTTGSNPGGYTLTSVDIVSADGEGDDFTMEICGTSGGNPNETCTALTAPGSFAAGTLTFTASPAISLSMGTTYALKTTGGENGLTLASVNTGGEDAGGAAGWSIADSAVYNLAGTWRDQTSELVITIKGTVGGGTPPLPRILIAANQATYTAKVDRITYTLTREGDTAAALDVSVNLTPPPGNDWNIPEENLTREVNFAAGEAEAELRVRLRPSGFESIGLPNSATVGGTLTAGIAALEGYDTTDTAAAQILVLPIPVWTVRAEQTALQFTEEGGAQETVFLVRAASAEMPPIAPGSSIPMTLITYEASATPVVDYEVFSQTVLLEDRAVRRRCGRVPGGPAGPTHHDSPGRGRGRRRDVHI